MNLRLRGPNPLASTSKSQHFADGFAVSFNEKSKTRALDGAKTSRVHNEELIGDHLLALQSPGAGSQMKRGKRKTLQSNFVDMNRKYVKGRPTKNSHLFASIH